MERFLQAMDFDLWMIMTQGPFLPTKNVDKGEKVVKAKKEFNADEKIMLEKYSRAKLILYNVLGLEEIDGISACNMANEILKRLPGMHEEARSYMALMVLINADSGKVNNEDIVSMMVMSDSEFKAGNEEVDFSDLKDNHHFLPKKNLSAMVL